MAEQKPKQGAKPPTAPKPRASAASGMSGMPSMINDEGLDRLMERFGNPSMNFGPGSAAWKSKFDQMGGMSSAGTGSGTGQQQTVVTHTRVTTGTGTTETKITRTSSREMKTMSQFRSFDQSNRNVVSTDGCGIPDSIRSLGSLGMEGGSAFSHQPSVKHSFGSLKRRFENLDLERRSSEPVFPEGLTQQENLVQKLSSGSGTTELHVSANDVASEQSSDFTKRPASNTYQINMKAGTTVNMNSSVDKSSTSPRAQRGVLKTDQNGRPGSPKLSLLGSKGVRQIPVNVVTSDAVGPKTSAQQPKMKVTRSTSENPPSNKKAAVKRPEPKPRTTAPRTTTPPRTNTPPRTTTPPRKNTPPSQSHQIKVIRVQTDPKEIPLVDSQKQNANKPESLLEKYKNVKAAADSAPPKQVVDIPIRIAKVESEASGSGSDYEDVMIPPQNRSSDKNAQKSPGLHIRADRLVRAPCSDTDSSYSKESHVQNTSEDSDSGDDYDEVYVSDGRLRFLTEPVDRRMQFIQKLDAENNNFHDVPIEYMDAGSGVVDDESDSDEGYEMVDEFLGRKSHLAVEEVSNRRGASQGKLGPGRRNQNKARYQTDPGLKSGFAVYSKEEAVSDPDEEFYDDVTSKDQDDHYEPVGQPYTQPEGDDDKSHQANAVKQFGRKAAGHIHAFKKKFATRLFSKGLEDEDLKSNSIDPLEGQEKGRSLSQPDPTLEASLSSKSDTTLDSELDTNQKVRSLSDIHTPRFGVFPEGDPPDRPPPRLKRNTADLNAVVPPPNISLGPSFPDGYLGNPQFSHSLENLVSGFPKMDLNARPPAALPRDATSSSSVSTTTKSSSSHTSYSWTNENGVSNSTTTTSSNIVSSACTSGMLRKNVYCERESRSSHSTNAGKTVTKVKKQDDYLHMSRTESKVLGDDSSSDDMDYIDAGSEEDRLKALQLSMQKSGAKVEIHGESSSSYLELLDNNVITQLKRVNRFQSRFGGDEAPLYQIYHKKMCVAAIREDEGADSDDEDNIYTTFSGPSSPAAIEAPPTSPRCDSPAPDAENQAIDYTTPSVQTFDLKTSSSGAVRSLWCEMPEVKQSGVLNRLTPQERKLQETLFEIITSEASYQKSLLVLVNNFLLDPMFSVDPKKCAINKRDKHFIFSNVVAVMESSENLLRDLEARWQKSCVLDDICDVVGDHASKNFDVYVRYCSNQMYQSRTLTKLLVENKEFREALHSLEKNPACQGLPMKSFLLLPMQRITRLPLLIDAVCHRCEVEKDKTIYPSAKRALEVIQGVVSKCNEGARNMERMEQMVEIERSLKFKVKKCPLISASRYLVKKGELLRISSETTSTLKRMVKAKASKTPIWLFLFNDLLMLTKKKGFMLREQYGVFDYCSRINISVELVEEPEHDPRVPENLSSTVKNLFILALLENHCGKQVELILSAESTSDRARWIEVLSPAKEESKDEKVYESWDCPQVQAVFQYEAKQPDELTLDESDVVNVIRKMGDGWFEGERIRDGQKGWFPSNHTMEIMNAHVRAKNLKQRYRLMVLSQQAVVEGKGSNVKVQTSQQKHMI
ncbi:uncharacterized protein LOC135496459 isoform X3 [Lineus longissimus]|uniref:uncharacterized protein LOC135496459 isoform X3 n=1 Tax=Lineus longissimus TaxID=88925 RepID=UPI00315DED11